MHGKANASSEGNILAMRARNKLSFEKLSANIGRRERFIRNTERQYIEAIGTTQHLVPFTDMQRRQRYRYVSRLFEFEIKCCLA